jgi:hypothetical protein
MSSRCTSIFKDPNVAKHLFFLHDKYVIASTDKAHSNIVCVCKSHYVVSWSIWQTQQYSAV